MEYAIKTMKVIRGNLEVFALISIALAAGVAAVVCHKMGL